MWVCSNWIVDWTAVAACIAAVALAVEIGSRVLGRVRLGKVVAASAIPSLNAAVARLLRSERMLTGPVPERLLAQRFFWATKAISLLDLSALERASQRADHLVSSHGMHVARALGFLAQLKSECLDDAMSLEGGAVLNAADIRQRCESLRNRATHALEMIYPAFEDAWLRSGWTKKIESLAERRAEWAARQMADEPGA